MKYIPTIFRRLLLWGHVAVFFGLLLSAYLRYLSPAQWWPAGFAGFPFPYLWILNCIFLPVWLIYRRKYWLISIAGILLTIPASMITWGYHPFGTEKPSASGSFTVMSFNCSSMGMKWYKDVVEVRDGIYEELVKAKPDVLCLQEFYSYDKPGKTNNLDSLLKKLNYEYYYFVPHVVRWDTFYLGTVLFSKFPIIDTARIELGGGPTSEDMITANLLVHGDTVRLLSSHLASYHLSKDNDYSVVSERDAGRVRGLMSKMRRSFSLRAEQAHIVRDQVAQSKYPVIVVGDFNDIPVSYTYRTIKGDNLQDAFLQHGFGFGRTFTSLARTLRIDYILPDKNFLVEDFSITRRKGFEHTPIMARLSLRH